MFKKTKFFVGIAFLVQSISFLCVFVVLLLRKKSLWKTFLAMGLAGAAVGGCLTYKSLKHDRKFKKVLESLDDLCSYDDEDDEVIDIPVDDTASEEEFEF